MKGRLVAVLAAALCIGVGLVAMTVAGAPSGLVLLQAAVGLVSLILAVLIASWRSATSELGPRLICLLALVLMASPLLFPGVEGVRRWIELGPLQVQPNAIALPLITWFAIRSVDHRLAALGMLIAGVLAALQPDQQATQGITAVALCMALLLRGGTLWWSVLGASIVLGVVAASGRALEPVPFVEQVLPLSFQAHWALGLAVAVGLAAVPLLMLVASPDRRPAAVALAALWVGLASACLASEFPTPVLGYGLSWILGFAISLGLAARRP